MELEVIDSFIQSSGFEDPSMRKVLCGRKAKLISEVPLESTSQELLPQERTKSTAERTGVPAWICTTQLVPH